MSELIYTEERDGFTINTYALPEHISPYSCFDYDDDDIDEICNAINDGALMWFAAHVQATRGGVTLADTYIGACCYENCLDFINDSDYYGDMVTEVIEAAKTKIAELTQEIE